MLCERLLHGTVELPIRKEETPLRLVILTKALVVLLFEHSFYLYNLREQYMLFSKDYEWEFEDLPPTVYSTQELVLRTQPSCIVLLNVFNGEYKTLMLCSPGLHYNVIFFSESKRLLIGTRSKAYNRANEVCYTYLEYPSNKQFSWTTGDSGQQAFDQTETLIAVDNTPYHVIPITFHLFNINDKYDKQYCVMMDVRLGAETEKEVELFTESKSDVNSIARYGRGVAVLVVKQQYSERQLMLMYNLDKRALFRRFELPTTTNCWIRPIQKQLMLEERSGSTQLRLISLTSLRSDWIYVVDVVRLEFSNVVRCDWSETTRTVMYLSKGNDKHVVDVIRMSNRRGRQVHLMSKSGLLAKWPQRLCDEVLKLLN